MKINERNLTNFSICEFPSDKEGWLWKKGELNTSYQKRWCVLRGNLLFYFEKKHDKEPIGVIVMENCTVQLAEGGDSGFTFSIIFDGSGMRTYKLTAEDEETCNEWIKSLSLCSFRYLKILVDELEKKNGIIKSSNSTLHVPDSQPMLPIRNATSMEDVTKKLYRHPKKHNNSEKNSRTYIDQEIKPYKFENSNKTDASKSKLTYYTLLEQPYTLLKAEYKHRGKSYIATDKSKIPTSTFATRSFVGLHEFYRRNIEENLVEET